MSASDERIAQWERMSQESPDDMAFFSLGNAYKDAERFEEAEASYGKAIEQNPQMSRAIQLRGQMLIKLEREDEAVELLTEGYVIAANGRDVMPQKAMGALLEKLGQPVPEIKKDDEPSIEGLDAESLVMDRRAGHAQPKLDGPPMKGKLGAFIAAHFGQITWNQWIGQGTKVINELRLDFSREDHQDTYEQQMLEWLQISMDEVEAWEPEG